MSSPNVLSASPKTILSCSLNMTSSGYPHNWFFQFRILNNSPKMALEFSWYLRSISWLAFSLCSLPAFPFTVLNMIPKPSWAPLWAPRPCCSKHLRFFPSLQPLSVPQWAHPQSYFPIPLVPSIAMGSSATPHTPMNSNFNRSVN